MDVSKKIERKLAFHFSIFQEIMQKSSAIDAFKGTWLAVENKERQALRELRKIATIQSVGSSTRIEGVQLTDNEIESFLQSVEIKKLVKRDEQEVVGYYEALETILDNFSSLEISERYIHQLHGILLKYSSKDQSHKGQYKKLSNQVVANYSDGDQKIIFRTTEPHLTTKEMADLIEWTNIQMEERKLHPLLITATFVYEFLSIHPYQDGNGRISRLLTTLLLLKQDYNFVEYISFEHLIEVRKEQYYRVLMETQKNRASHEELLDKWVIFFLDCLVNLTQKLKRKYAVYKSLRVKLNKRQEQIMAVIKQNEIVQMKDLEKELSDYSRNTLKKDAQFLVREGFIIKLGAGRGVRYYLNDLNS